MQYPIAVLPAVGQRIRLGDSLPSIRSLSPGSGLGFGDSAVGTLIGAIRRIARVVEKFAFLLAGRALIGVRIRLKGVAAI